MLQGKSAMISGPAGSLMKKTDLILEKQEKNSTTSKTATVPREITTSNLLTKDFSVSI